MHVTVKQSKEFVNFVERLQGETRIRTGRRFAFTGHVGTIFGHCLCQAQMSSSLSCRECLWATLLICSIYSLLLFFIEALWWHPKVTLLRCKNAYFVLQISYCWNAKTHINIVKIERTRIIVLCNVNFMTFTRYIDICFRITTVVPRLSHCRYTLSLSLRSGLHDFCKIYFALYKWYDLYFAFSRGAAEYSVSSSEMSSANTPWWCP